MLLWGCGSATTKVAEKNPDEQYFALPSGAGLDTVTSEKQQFVLDTLVTDLENPWSMEFLPNGDVLITERPGRLRLVRNGKLVQKPVEGLPPIWFKGQGGLLDVVKHPDYEQNGWLYITYAALMEDSTSNTHLLRARLQDSVLVDQEVIFKAEYYNKKGQHFGGRVAFDKDNYLFLTVGERGDRHMAQSLANYNGKLYRLHDDGRVPEDNPYVAVDTALAATWSWGHRNPQGLVFHPETGVLWEHEHGPRGGDELNIIKPAVNYGWPAITYGINYNGTIITEDTVQEGMAQPQHFWRPSIAPCGMDFVSSDKYPGWKGDLMVGSLKFRYVARCELENNQVVHEEKLLEPVGRIRTIKQAPDGFLYVVTEGPGMLLRILPVNNTPASS